MADPKGPPAPDDPTPPGAQVTAATFTAATTSTVLWLLNREVFHGEGVPPEIYTWVMLAVPALLGRLGAELAYRSAKRRAR